MSAGGTPAVLFYLLDRHALLAMTMESKCIFLNSLTTPPEPPTRHVARGPVLGHPSNGGELVPRQDEGKVPLCGGVARSAGVVIVRAPLPLVIPAPIMSKPSTFLGYRVACFNTTGF